MPITSLTLNLQEARDSYQLAQAEGFTGTRTEWLASLIGPPGTTVQEITAGNFAKLTPEQQEDPTIIYAIVGS